ncbi:MAG TPA: J domain-containing protein [Nocardioidaceae bacterium]|nr:J domain-containing protein [Nocardioidaceae bacterium]
MNPTLYDVLGVSREASREEIRKAWRDAADRFEPGEGGSTRQFRLFNEAAEVLLDPERRKAYDATLEEERTAPAEPSAVPGPPMPGASSAAAPAAAAPAPAGTATERAGTPDRAQGLGRRTVGVLVALGLLAALAVGAGAYFGSRGWAALQEDRQAEQYQEALDRAPAAAESAAAAVLSYDYRSLEADRDAAARFLTEGYRAEYVETFDKLVVDSATQTKASVEAEVLASAAMNSADRDASRIPVLLFVNQVTTSTTSAEPSVALNRVRLDMVEADGGWLVDGITSY